MEITRKINGQKYTFKLTKKELVMAYYEQQLEFDKQDIRDIIAWIDNEECRNAYGVSKTKFRELTDEMAKEMRKNIDKYGMQWSYARDDAVVEVLSHLEDNE